MTFSDHVAQALGVLCVCIFAAAGICALASLYRDLTNHRGRIAEVWCAMVERIAERWHAVAVLFPVTGTASSDRQAEEPR
ncbi:hypothetical protein BRX36_20260 [Sphingomonas sp. S-NIH.Pt1_0416]|uniref:hypothetical protein n=1 Tax=Sphingomonas TaxID=13687 RepID=UPI00064C1335|nr:MULTISPECIES: hypothetical protein [Sphingomonas]RSU58599.1 hypothetical protein BRX36_20260 [Sphingomonas sp. S-NIH.Pt1_0416]